MGDRPTLILTTRLGVRPLGVRGDALHNVAGQLLAVIRRRLGEGPANLLAEPQLREGGDGIDWYAARSGEVRRFADLSESERAATLETVEHALGGHPVPGRGAEGIDEQRRGAPDRPLARAGHGASVRRLHLPGRWRAGDRGLGLRGRRCRGPRRLRPAARAGTAAACAGGAGERARGRAACPACLGAVAERAAVRPPAPAAAPDHLVAAARLRPGRSLAQHRHPGDARAARARTAARSDAAAEGLARFGGRPTRTSSRPSSPPSRPSSRTRWRCASRSSRPSRRLLRRHHRWPRPPPPPPPQQQAAVPQAPPAAPINRPPPGTLPCNWSGDSGGEGVTRNRHYLGDKPGFRGASTTTCM